ncbi:hypothetical protein [Daejeonella sp. H1SJ63]|uniref:hypothetical protein n=1 Tax=Daejeonella sp. H1SJ63 TaxID=3034145 RepID=UPI0023EC0F96|nr:hypothetical protein [Daejeonella sp. H1SJ63]
MKRRSFVKNSTLSAFGIAAFGAFHWNGKSFEGDNITTTDILGSYYRPGSPMRSNLPPGPTGQVLYNSFQGGSGANQLKFELLANNEFN